MEIVRLSPGATVPVSSLSEIQNGRAVSFPDIANWSVIVPVLCSLRLSWATIPESVWAANVDGVAVIFGPCVCIVTGILGEAWSVSLQVIVMVSTYIDHWPKAVPSIVR